MKRKGFLSRLADKLFGGVRKTRRKATRRPPRERQAPPTPAPILIEDEAPDESGHVNYQLTGWRVEGGEWQDVEAGAELPRKGQWKRIDLVTVNLAPDTEDGFYRSANVFGGFDEYPNKPRYDFYDEDPSYTLDNLAYELALEYGFAVQ